MSAMSQDLEFCEFQDEREFYNEESEDDEFEVCGVWIDHSLRAIDSV